jgi:hypothetical protein
MSRDVTPVQSTSFKEGTTMNAYITKIDSMILGAEYELDRAKNCYHTRQGNLPHLKGKRDE